MITRFSHDTLTQLQENPEENIDMLRGKLFIIIPLLKAIDILEQDKIVFAVCFENAPRGDSQ